MFCHKLMWHQTAMTIKGCLILIWSCLEGFCEPTALHKLTQLPVFYGETINVFFFSLLQSANEQREKGGLVRWGWNVCWWSNTVLLSFFIRPTTNREKNKESALNGSLMNNKTPLMFWCSHMIRIWIYRGSPFFCWAHYRNHWQILPQEQLAANRPSSEEFFFEGN